MSSQFSACETTCLERETEVQQRFVSFNDIFNSEQQNRVLKWIKENGFTRVRLICAGSALKGS